MTLIVRAKCPVERIDNFLDIEVSARIDNFEKTQVKYGHTKIRTGSKNSMNFIPSRSLPFTGVRHFDGVVRDIHSLESTERLKLAISQ